MDKFHQLVKLTDPTKKIYKLIQYSKIRWLSLTKCVTRLKDVLSHLNEFFIQESDDTVRSLAEDLFIRTNDLKFRLYLDFLYDALPMPDEINKYIQTPNVDINKVCCAIESFCKAFSSPLLINPNLSASDDNNHVKVEDVIFHGANCNRLLSECKDNSDLTIEEIGTVRSNCVKFMLTVAQQLESRFPEMDFILKNFTFVNPINRDFRSTNLDKLFARFPSCDQSKVSRGYARYIFDKNVDYVFHHCDGNIVKL